jgi:sugar O-acyltransferase (sialic acid O-acetyltransferase NeuD family)
VSKDALELVIFPCNGNAVEALDCLGDEYRLIAFIDDTTEKQGREVFGCPVFGREALARWSNVRVLAIPGSPASYLSRRKIIEGLGVDADRFATVVHRKASVSRMARIGRNVLIMAGVVITSNAVIGDNVCILPNTVIHHDAMIGAWSLIGSNVTIAGNSVVGVNCYIGSGSSIMNGVQVGEGALVGLGSNVIRSVRAGSTVAGNPAREIIQEKST